MFGRKRKEEVRRVASFAEIWDAVEEWAGELKKPFQAAGFDLEGAAKHIDTRENKASGSAGHPWPLELKFRMLQAINGASDVPIVNQRIERLQMDHEQALRGEQANG